jgi:hypothetical protein
MFGDRRAKTEEQWKKPFVSGEREEKWSAARRRRSQYANSAHHWEAKGG